MPMSEHQNAAKIWCAYDLEQVWGQLCLDLAQDPLDLTLSLSH